MKENKKVYVRAIYIGGKLSSAITTYQQVVGAFIQEVKSYTENEDFEYQYIDDKFIAKMKGTGLLYELFICNFNEISNYLH